MDEDLCTAVKKQLGVDASKAFSKRNSNGVAVEGEPLPQKGALPPGAELLTAEEYVARTLPLLELERKAEEAQVRRSLLKSAFNAVSMHLDAFMAASEAPL